MLPPHAQPPMGTGRCGGMAVPGGRAEGQRTSVIEQCLCMGEATKAHASQSVPQTGWGGVAEETAGPGCWSGGSGGRVMALC